MISDLEIIDKGYLLLKVPDILNAITGGVYKSKRPVNSRKIDIVVGCLPTNNLQIQTAIMNVNIYVPNLIISVNGSQGNSQPDFAKLRTLTGLVIPKLKDQWFQDYWLDVESQHTFSEDETNEHYSNIRVKLFSINV